MYMRYITLLLILFAITIANALFINDVTALDLFPLRGESSELILGLGYPSDICFSPKGDSVVCNSSVGYLLWDVTKNPPEPSLLLDKNSGYRPIQFLADGTQLAIKKENSFKIIDVATKETIYENTSPDLRYASLFSPDEKKVLSSYMSKIEIYDLEGRKIVKTIPHSSPAVELSADNRWVGVEGTNASPVIWNYETGKLKRLPDAAHSDLTFSKDGKWMATEYSEPYPIDFTKVIETHRIEVIDIETGDTIYAFTPKVINADGWHAPLEQFLDMKFSRANQNILYISLMMTGDVYVIDITTGKARRLNTPNLENLAYTMVYFKTDAYDKRLMTFNEDHIIRIWDVETGQETARIDAYPRRFLSGVFSPDGKSVLTGHWEPPVRNPETTDSIFVHQWDVETGKSLRSLAGHSDGVEKIVFTADGKNALSGSGREIIFWDAMEWKPLWSIPSNFGLSAEDLKSRYIGASSSTLMSVALSGDGKSFVSIYRQDAFLRDMETKEILQVFTGHSKTIRDVAISPDGSLVATGGGECNPDLGLYWDATARIFDRQTGKQLVRIQHNNPVISVQFSSDGQKLLTGSWDNTAAMWDVKTGKLIRRFEHDNSWLRKAAYTPDNKHILTVAYPGWRNKTDSEVRIWDLDGNVIYSLKPTKTDSMSWFLDADLSPDQQKLLTVTDNAAQIWDIPGVLQKLSIVRPTSTDVIDYSIYK
ncbi:MAG: WD40 repeat domain-containing protein [Candidatus Omnitrophota bacterium]